MVRRVPVAVPRGIGGELIEAERKMPYRRRFGVAVGDARASMRGAPTEEPVVGVASPVPASRRLEP